MNQRISGWVSRKPLRECPWRVLHMQPDIPRHAWKSNDGSCPRSALIARSSWNRSFLANARRPRRFIAREEVDYYNDYTHPGTPFRRNVLRVASVIVPPRCFLTVHFLGHRKTRYTYCKGPIVKYGTGISNNEKDKRARKFVCVGYFTSHFILYIKFFIYKVFTSKTTSVLTPIFWKRFKITKNREMFNLFERLF